MIKKLLVTAAALSATLAYGNINVAWQGSSGFFANGSAGNYPADGINNFNGGSTLAQLIWSADDVANDAVATGDFTSGNDILLSTYTVVGPPADNFAYFVAPVAVYLDATFGQALANGWVYARIFQDTTPEVNDFYYTSRLLDATAYTGNEAPQLVELNTDIVNGNELDQQIVPEPSILAFLGMGGLLMVIRRNRK